MSVADSLVLQSLHTLHEQLETRLTAKMEWHHESLLEAMRGVQREGKRGGAPVKERAAGDGASLSDTEMSQQGARGNEPVCSDALALGGAPQEAAGCGGAGVWKAAPRPGQHDITGPQEHFEQVLERRHTESSGTSRGTSRTGKRRASLSSSELRMQSLHSLQRQMTVHEINIKGRSGTTSGTMSQSIVDSADSMSMPFATRLATSWKFETLVTITIVLNAVSIGWYSDWCIKNPGSTRPTVFLVLDWTFLVICTLELVLRMVAEGRKFVTYGERMFGWNLFDTLVVLLTMLGEIDVIGVKTSVVRVFRVLRLVYVVRVIRTMPNFSELRMMIDGIMNCGKTLLWSSLVLGFFTYVYAVVVLQLSSEWLSTVGVEGSACDGQRTCEHDEETMLFLGDNFPSLVYSVYTLFKAVAGGVSWGELSDPLQDVSALLITTFPLYIIFTVFCVLNIVTAAFVDAASRKSQDDESLALEKLAERTRWIDVITEIFHRHDSDHSSSLDWEEFKAIMEDWRTAAAFEAIGIDFSFHDGAVLFELFDWDGDGHIDINEFAQGVHHLKGAARSLDMFHQFLELSHSLNRLTKMVSLDQPFIRAPAGEI